MRLKHLDTRVLFNLYDVSVLVFFLVYLYLSLVFANSRVLYADSAYYLFRMIENNGFNIEHGRYIAILSQLLPVAFIKMQLPLKLVILAYSFNVALVNFFAYLFVRYYLRNQWYALGVVLLSTVTLHYSYYFACSEIMYGIIITYVGVIYLYNVLEKKQKLSKIELIILVILSVMIFFSHLLLMAAYLAIAGIFLIQFRSKNHLSLFGTLILLVVIRYFMSTYNNYESGMMSSILLRNLKAELMNESYMIYFIKHSFNGNLFYAKLLCFLAIGYSLFCRKIFLTVSFVALLSALYVIIYLYMPAGNALAYMDSYLGVLGLVAIAFFIISAKELPRISHLVLGFLLLIIAAISINRIAHENTYHNRIAYYKTLFEEMEKDGFDKGIIKSENAEWQYFLVGWTVPFESLLFSSSLGNSKTIYIDDNQLDPQRSSVGNLFLGESWDPYHSIDRLDPKYFELSDDSYVQWH